MKTDARHETYVMVKQALDRLASECDTHPDHMLQAVLYAAIDIASEDLTPERAVSAVGILYCFTVAYDKHYPDRVYEDVAG